MGQPEVTQTSERPWTVYALVVLTVVSVAWGQIVDVDRTLWDIAAVVISLLIAWGLWTGKQGAFTLLFVLASLCLVVAVGGVLIQVFVTESSPSLGLIVTGAISVLWVALLLRPETKRFAGLKRLTPSPN